MRATATLLLIAAMSLVMGCASSQDAGVPGTRLTELEQPVHDALLGFYAAEERLFQGEMVPMESVWSRRSDITYLSPTGRFNVGWDEVMADWRSQANRRLGGTIEPRNIHILVAPGSDLAVAQNFEVATGQTIDGRRSDLTIRATNVFRKENGRWMMVSHATDVIPGLVQPD